MDIQKVIEDNLASALGKLGEFTWAYVVLSKNKMSVQFFATNYPEEWVKTYQEQSLHFTDPVVINALNRLTPFLWDEKTETDNKFCSPGIFDKAKNHNVKNGYTFVLHDYKNNMATLSFVIDPERRNEIEDFLFKHRGDINILLTTVHERYLALMMLSENNELHSVNKNLFTDRENEILYWASVGKTYLETGIILGIKTTTVKFHMANIVKKLGVTNARHAVRLGVGLDLVKPVTH
ncbi:LuxR family transcriptional regulator [Pantoea sp. MBD-2R]|uniref:LuxR family transcriptional regulator n=1 Tax=Pantoea sp. MBD-2R TaxID=3141540 RepID=UPI0031839A7E